MPDGTQEFREWTKTTLTEIQQALRGVEQHLARLNGTVADHSEKLVALRIREAQREGSASQVDRMRDDLSAQIAGMRRHVEQGDLFRAGQKAERDFLSRLQPWIQPIVTLVATALILTAVGEHHAAGVKQAAEALGK